MCVTADEPCLSSSHTISNGENHQRREPLPELASFHKSTELAGSVRGEVLNHAIYILSRYRNNRYI